MTRSTACQHLQTTILRGGLFPKFGKRASSYEPILGLIGAAALFGASPGQAANERGAENLTDPADMITCTALNYAGGPGYPDFPADLAYTACHFENVGKDVVEFMVRPP